MQDSAQKLTLITPVIKPKNKGGRPKRIISEMEYEFIERACEIGLTAEQISKLLKCSLRQFEIYKKKDKRIKTYWEQGKIKKDIYVAGKLFEQIEKGDKTCIIFYMKTQMRWATTEKQEVKMSIDKNEVAKDIEDKLFGV